MIATKQMELQVQTAGRIVPATIQLKNTYRKELHYAISNDVCYMHSDVLSIAHPVEKKGWYEITKDAIEELKNMFYAKGFSLSPGALLQDKPEITVFDDVCNSLPKWAMQLIEIWAKEFGHEINKQDGYVYYKDFYEKPTIVAVPGLGTTVVNITEERGCRLYLNYWKCGSKTFLKGVNHRKGIDIDVWSQLCSMKWIKDQKFKKNI